MSPRGSLNGTLSGEGQVLTLPIARSSRGALGFGLNEANRVTDLGLQAASGLRAWDLCLAIDGVPIESTLKETLGDITNKPVHDLTVLRMKKVPPLGSGSGPSVLTATLEKQSPGFGHAWQKREFQLQGDTLWYRSREAEPRSISLQNLVSIRIVDHKAREFHLATRDGYRVFKFRAPDSATLFQWVTALQVRHVEVNPKAGQRVAADI